MKNLFEVIDSIRFLAYCFAVILLRLFRVISHKRFIELLFGDSEGYQDEDVLKIKK